MFSVDQYLFRWLYGGDAHGVWLWIMAGLTIVGSGWSMLVIAPFALPARTRHTTLRLLGALLVTTIVVFGLKALVGRTRPCASGIPALLFAAPTDPSFPSGHAAGAFAFAAFLAAVVLRTEMPRRRRWTIVTALFVFAVGIALSRVVLGVHFPSDVLVGAAIGTLLGFATARISVERRGGLLHLCLRGHSRGKGPTPRPSHRG